MRLLIPSTLKTSLLSVRGIFPSRLNLKKKTRRGRSVANDADVFALLLHFVFTGDIKGTVIMEPNSVDKHVIDVNATARKHAEIAPPGDGRVV